MTLEIETLPQADKTLQPEDDDIWNDDIGLLGMEKSSWDTINSFEADETSTLVVGNQALRPKRETPVSDQGNLVIIWLLIWMANNLALTILNKATFSTFDFKYPFFLSFVHMVVNYLGSECVFFWKRLQSKKHMNHSNNAHELFAVTRTKLNGAGRIRIFLFSLVFSLNVALGNLALRHTSVNFNQIMRSLVPALIIFLGMLMGRKTSYRRKLTVIPVIIGVALACLGDMTFSVIGFIFTALAVVLAALKVVASGEMLSGEFKLHPVDLLSKMTPSAAVQCLILSFLTGEVKAIMERWDSELNPAVNFAPALALLSTGLMAFSLNIASLITNKLTSPLTLCIASNVKQVLMILFASMIFHTPISILNGFGIFVVLCGSATYSYVSVLEKNAENQNKE
eukprot:CAMPEP_0198285922 /NCGR_PEP_ID=MMETSP1449-20131203/5145_1 /TAXON_ID=420275 /ORGANISM="Attheya septentrionalis, Strain CCMP2084" /LENGTH=396 /DNA_ID=CAMNT_0043983535 /DNA_START=167 /DNA_END=1357 /DNA_ORIENTATION=-